MIRRILNMCSRMKAPSQRVTSSRGGLGIFSVRAVSICAGKMLMKIGNGIINADGDLWKVQRKAGLNFLSSANLKVLTDVALPEYLDKTILGLEEKDSESVVDLEEVLHELTTQIMGQMAYNVSRLI